MKKNAAEKIYDDPQIGSGSLTLPIIISFIQSFYSYSHKNQHAHYTSR